MSKKHKNEQHGQPVNVMEEMMKAGVVPGQTQPLTEEEQKPLSRDARAQLWGDATSRGMWVINFGSAGRVVVLILIALALATFVYGWVSDQPLLRILGLSGALVLVVFGAAMAHHISVDRSAKQATLRFGFLPLVGFSYPLNVVSIEHQSTFSLVGGKAHNMLYFSGDFDLAKDESGRVQISLADGFRPRRTQLISTKDRTRVVELKRQLEALIDPPPLKTT